MMFLKGYRSYIVAVGFLAAGLTKYLDGGSFDTVVQYVLSGLATAFIRNAIPSTPSSTSSTTGAQ